MVIKNNTKGFSLLEFLIAVSVIGIIASISYAALGGINLSSKNQKLISDVYTVNRSIAAYLAAGGDVSKLNNPASVLNALKANRVNNSNAPGLVGSKLDSRINVEVQSAGDAGTDELRAYWSPTSKRFYTTTMPGDPGVKRFYLDDSLADVDYGESKQSYLFEYASTDPWIWDFKETKAPVRSSTTPVTKKVAVKSVAPSSVAPPSPLPVAFATLAPPLVSRDSGSYAFSEFSQPVVLTDPNPSSASDLFYSVDFSNWKKYTSPFTVAPGSVVSTQAIAKTINYESSSRVDKSYEAKITQLKAPIISPDRTKFGFFFGRTINLTLIDPNSPGIAGLQYRIAGGPWQNYNSKFKLKRSDYPSGVLIQARSVSTNPYYTSSTTSLRTLLLDTAEISGDSGGSFSEPVGQIKMATNLAAGQSSDYFEWGRDYYTAEEIDFFFLGDTSLIPATDKSTLSFSGHTFDSVESGRRFEVGSLSYHNGTIVVDTGADAIKLGVDLNFDIDGFTASSSFDFDLNLINVANLENPLDPWADADFVQLASPVASETLLFNGIEFQFQLEFGETTTDGLSYFDEFHVLEGKDASTKVYGTLVEIGSIDFND